jgi:hypothetical protein
MTPEEKRLKITAPMPLEKALDIYGVQSEAELMSLLKDKFETYSQNFLQNQEKKTINFKFILLIIFVLLVGSYFIFSERIIEMLK